MKNKQKQSKEATASMSIADLAKILNISKSSMRFYEAKGLIRPDRNADSNYRNYSIMTLVELTDILLYRRLGIPVREIPQIMNSPVEASLDTIDQAIDETHQQIQTLNETLQYLHLYERKVRRYLSLKDRKNPYQIVDTPDIQQMYFFDFSNPVHMEKYLTHSHTFSYGIYIEDPLAPCDYVSCSLSGSMEDRAEAPVWDTAVHQGQYLECLMYTEYGSISGNNIGLHLQYMKEHGLKAGSVIADYLVSDYPSHASKKYDFFQAWIQILP